MWFHVLAFITIVLQVIIILLLMVGIATAGSSVDWGGTTCKIELTPKEHHVAKITCRNVLTGATGGTEVLKAGPVSVSILTNFTGGVVPDDFTPTTEEGFAPFPSKLTLPENGVGTILIFDLGTAAIG